MDNINICTDCLDVLANGGGSIAVRKTIAEINTEGYLVEAGTGQQFFSWQPCDLCGDDLGGDRHEATLVPMGGGPVASL